MKKEEFLNNLEQELKLSNAKNYQDVLEYYNEVIEDKIDKGKKEEKVIIELGDIKDIVRNVKIENTLDKATKEPTISNGLKALIAVLSVLSLPLLIPVIVVAVVLIFVVLVLLACIIIVISSLLLSSIIIAIALFINLLAMKIPIYTFFFGLGISFILAGLFIFLFKWSLGLFKQFTVWFIDSLKEKFGKKRGAYHE